MFENCEPKFAVPNSISFLNSCPSKIVRRATSPKMKCFGRVERIETLVHLMDDLKEVS
jgi:hypothetical protein